MSSKDAYSAVKSSKLKLKGDESSSKSKKHKKSHKRKSTDISDAADLKLEDELNHAGGWVIESLKQVVGTIFIEFREYMYMHGLDNGLFVLGSPHLPTERPEVCELLTALPIDEKYVAFKSAYGKYLSVNQNGLLVGRSEAIGTKEYFQIEFDYDYTGRKSYIKASNEKYLGVNHDGDIVAMFDKNEDTNLTLRSLNKRDNNSKKNLPEEEKGDDLKNVELNYVKKFQKFQDKRIKTSEEDVGELLKAKEQGNLHESLLDRREKMKADRYCK